MATGRLFPVQTVHIGQTSNYATMNVSALAYAGQLGMVFEDGGKAFRIVQLTTGTAAVASIAGGVVYWSDRANFKVSTDQTDSEANINGVAGATLLAGVTDLNYCVIQIGGLQSCKVAALTAAGDNMIGSTTDGTFGRVAVGAATVQSVIFAIAWSAVSSNFSNVYWQLGTLL